MTTTKILNAQHLLTFHSDIKEALDSKSVTISTFSLIIAGGIFSLASFIDDKTSGLYLATVFAPFAFLLLALFRLIYKRKKLVYSPTGSPIVSGQLYFDKSQLDNVSHMLKSDSAENIEWTGFKQNGNARLHYLVSKDGQFAAIQLYEYVPYNYEPVSEIFYYADHKVHPIAQLLLQSVVKH